jgi:signal transduction histidine kinase
MTTASRAGTVAVMRVVRTSAAGRWRSSLVQDVVLAAALLLAAELEVVLDGLGVDCAVLAVLATLPLALRRQAPVVSFACVAVLAPTLDRALGSPWGQQANALVFLILASSYAVGAHAPLRRSLAAIGGAMVWLATLEAVWGDGQDYAFLVLLLGVPWVAGRGVRKYRRQTARLHELTARLQAERAVSERIAVARERERMAHETHDAIAHTVGEMVVQASGAEHVFRANPARAREALAAVQQAGRDAVDELRAILGVLRSGDEPALPVGHAQLDLEPGRKTRTRSWRAFLDAGLALGLLALGVAYSLNAAALVGQRLPALLVQVVAVAAVALRGPRPFAALPLAALAYAGEALLVDGDPGSPATIAALLLTTYSAAARAGRLGAIGAAVLALGLPAVIALAIADADAADVILPVTIIGIPWLAGRAVAAYRRQSTELGVLAQRLARERDARARLAVLDERARLARELHDSVAHAISVMVLQAGAAEQVLDSRPERAREAMRAVQDVGRDALDQIGSLLGLLEPTDTRPPLSPRPGLADLEPLLGAVRQAGLPVRLTMVGAPRPLPAALDGAAYRVVQEAVTNALKHAAAASTDVTVRFAADGVHLDIVDTGTASPAPTLTGGHGLAGMRERVAQHGGLLRAGPVPGGSGFAVHAFLPYARARRAEPESVHA